MGETGHVSAQRLRCCAQFAEGLGFARAGRREEALDCLRANLEEAPQDGPTRFYVTLRERDPPWRGEAVTQTEAL